MSVPRDDERLAITIDLPTGTVRDAIRDGVGVCILLVVAAFVAALPGAGRELPGTGLAVGALLSTAVSLGIVATILVATSSVGALVEAALRGPSAVVEDFASTARYALVFVAVLVTHRGVAPIVVPLLAADAVWIYDVAFLGFALFPVLAIARRLHRNADVMATDLAIAVTGSSPDSVGDP